MRTCFLAEMKLLTSSFPFKLWEREKLLTLALSEQGSAFMASVYPHHFLKAFLQMKFHWRQRFMDLGKTPFNPCNSLFSLWEKPEVMWFTAYLGMQSLSVSLSTISTNHENYGLKISEIRDTKHLQVLFLVLIYKLTAFAKRFIVSSISSNRNGWKSTGWCF